MRRPLVFQSSWLFSVMETPLSFGGVHVVEESHAQIDERLSEFDRQITERSGSLNGFKRRVIKFLFAGGGYIKFQGIARNCPILLDMELDDYYSFLAI